MTTRTTVKLLHEGRYAVEIPIDLIEDDHEWAPFVSAADVRKLDEVRLALRSGDLAAAAKLGKVFELRPVAPASVAAE